MTRNATRRDVLGGVLTAAALGPTATRAIAGKGSARKPNIVMFLGEGLRWDEFSVAGHPLLRTPHMDRIAREGARFRNAFCTNALCLPSRATFLTGAYSHTTGAVTNDQNQVPANFRMFTDVLRDAGYETAFIGKSHVGGALLDHSWDYYFGFKGQADYLHPRIVEGRNGVYKPEQQYDGYVDDLLTDKASSRGYRVLHESLTITFADNQAVWRVNVVALDKTRAMSPAGLASEMAATQGVARFSIVPMRS